MRTNFSEYNIPEKLSYDIELNSNKILVCCFPQQSLSRIWKRVFPRNKLKYLFDCLY